MSDSPEKKNPWAKHFAKQSATPHAVKPAAQQPSSPASPLAPISIRPTTARTTPWAKSLAKPGSASRLAADAAVAAVLPKRPPTAEPVARPQPPIFVERSPSPLPERSAPAKLAAPQKSNGKAEARGTTVSDEMATALATLAAEYAPLPVTTAPFVSLKESAAEAQKRRRLRRRWLIKHGAGLLVGIGVLYAVAATLLFRAPSDEALAAEAAHTAQLLLPLYSSSAQPLEIASAIPVLSETFNSGYFRYHAEVTLRLRQPLYGPAQTNGTEGYLMLQLSLQGAHERALNAGLFSLNDGPKPPDLPRLIQLVHAAGEPLVVRVPFEAKKFGWEWRIQPPQLAKRTENGHFDGVPLSHYGDAPYLIFGIPETMPDIRARTDAARTYITTIVQEIQRHSAERASADAPVAEPAPLPPRPAYPVPLPGNLPMIDPDKPAVESNAISIPGVRRPIYPDRPAADPKNR